MIRKIAVSAVSTLSLISILAVAKEPEWYTISQQYGWCEKTDSPVKYIKDTQALKAKYTMDDIADGGVIVETTMRIGPGPEFLEIHLYREKTRCDNAVSLARKKNEEELEKYR